MDGSFTSEIFKPISRKFDRATTTIDVIYHATLAKVSMERDKGGGEEFGNWFDRGKEIVKLSFLFVPPFSFLLPYFRI